jgi:hypothetical protein
MHGQFRLNILDSDRGTILAITAARKLCCSSPYAKASVVHFGVRMRTRPRGESTRHVGVSYLLRHTAATNSSVAISTGIFEYPRGDLACRHLPLNHVRQCINYVPILGWFAASAVPAAYASPSRPPAYKGLLLIGRPLATRSNPTANPCKKWLPCRTSQRM